MRHAAICLLLLLLALPMQSQSPELVEIARRSAQAAFPGLSIEGAPAVTPLANIRTTALGCRLIDGLPLPASVEGLRLEFALADEPVAVHVSADGSMAQPCDERFPNLGAGVIPLRRARLDSDGDGLSDDADACPAIAGLLARERPGCPIISAADRDGDGTPDARDRCPDQAGAAAANGCSLMRDGDGDGAPDHVDICPADAGVIRLDFALGCPADGSGSSPRRRGADDICGATGDGLIYAGPGEDAGTLGTWNETPAAAVGGRSAALDWYQLAGGWVKAGESRLSGACYNIPLVNPTPGGASGCFFRPRADFANVRQAPGDAWVTRIYDNQSYAALGRNFNGDWLYYRGGWVSRAVLELSGTCDKLPLLDPAEVAAGVIHFCPPDYPNMLPPRISIGEHTAGVASHTIANRLRAAPNIAAEQIGEIPPRSTLDAVLDGPACNAPHIWWQVEFAGLVGWTAESDFNANYYYLKPLIDSDRPRLAGRDPGIKTPSASALPASDRIIHSANAAALDTIRAVAADAPISIAWSPLGSALAVIGESGSVALYPNPHNLPVPIDALRDNGRRATAAVFRPDAQALAIGHADGAVTLVALASYRPDGAVALGGLDGPIRGLAWARAGDKLAAISGDENLKLARRAGSLKLWQLNPDQPGEHSLLLHYVFPYPLTALAFSDDGRLLAVAGDSTSNRRAGLWIYRVADGALLFSKALVPTGGSAWVAPSPDAALGDFVYSSGDSLYQIDAESGVEFRIYHQAGMRLPHFAFRRQVIPDAEALLALTTRAPRGETRLRVSNALNPYSPIVALDAAPAAIAFSPDGRALAVAERVRDRVLILGVPQSERLADS